MPTHDAADVAATLPCRCCPPPPPPPPQVLLRRFPKSHPFANLSGTENIISFTTLRYRWGAAAVQACVCGWVGGWGGGVGCSTGASVGLPLVSAPAVPSMRVHPSLLLLQAALTLCTPSSARCLPLPGPPCLHVYAATRRSLCGGPAPAPRSLPLASLAIS